MSEKHFADVGKKDTISRQAAIDAIEPTIKSILQGNSFKAINVMDKIRSLPSAQPEIVRCKDCKWYKTNFSWNGQAHKVCVIEPYEPVRKGDDFCSRGERKDG